VTDTPQPDSADIRRVMWAIDDVMREWAASRLPQNRTELEAMKVHMAGAALCAAREITSQAFIEAVDAGLAADSTQFGVRLRLALAALGITVREER